MPCIQLDTGWAQCLKGSALLLQAACTKRESAALLVTSEVESTKADAPLRQPLSMVDLWQPIKDNTAQQATIGWERKLDSAGGSLQRP